MNYRLGWRPSLIAMSVIASHTGRSKAIDADPVAVETIEPRKSIERQDWAFVAQLRAAILRGLETPAGVLGHQHHRRQRVHQPASGRRDAGP
jgi:hypothetical protein